ncbi:MAG: hypothetical protein HYS12_10115 [Planctomycetes bacterium]|nr:hypothetical protein [Planctomycetota bacterium]
MSEATLQARLILNDALHRYRQPDGYEGDLVEAAWQLEEIGKDAWPALSELAFSCLPESEFFLGAIVRIEGVSPTDRRSVLLAAAKNPDVNVRSRLLELVEELSADLKCEVVAVLAACGNPDDAVTNRAQDARTVLEAQDRREDLP